MNKACTYLIVHLVGKSAHVSHAFVPLGVSGLLELRLGPIDLTSGSKCTDVLI